MMMMTCNKRPRSPFSALFCTPSQSKMRQLFILIIYFVLVCIQGLEQDFETPATPSNDKSPIPDVSWEIWKRDNDVLIDSTPSNENEMTNDTFCMDMSSMRMVMFVKGFRRSLSRSSNEMLPCLSYYVSSWVLDDRGKFKGAMIYSFLMGLVTQGLAVIRAVVFMHIRKYEARKYLMVAIYVLQVFMGYMIMLIAMMYSVELLLSAVAGLSFGYFLFHKGESASMTPARRRRSNMQEPLLAEHSRSANATTAT